MRIAMLQGPVAADVAGALDEIASAAADAAARGAQILVCAELTCTGYRAHWACRAHWAAEPQPDEHSRGPIGTAVTRAARDTALAIAYGYAELDRTATDDADCRDGGVYRDGGDGRDGEDGSNTVLHNAVAVIGPDGDVLAHYRKTHLYRPTDQAGGSPDDRPFVPGTDLVVQFPFDGLTCGILICYDIEFPEAVRAHALAGTDWLLVPTALAYPDTHVTTVLVPARAIENQLFLTYVNRVGRQPCDDSDDGDNNGGDNNGGGCGGEAIVYCGLSCTVGPDGQELARARDRPALLVADLDPAHLAASRRRNPYLHDRRPDLYRDLL